MPPSWPVLPISSLPVWTALHGVAFFDTAVAPSPLPAKGNGLIARRALAHGAATADKPVLLRVPSHVVLSQETVEQYAKADVVFGQLLHAVDKRNMRMDILLFLLAHVCRARASTSSTGAEHLPLATPWSEYIRFLPSDVHTPTTWSKAELHLLATTSLAEPLNAKLLALEFEFTHLTQATSGLEYWDPLLWGYPEPFTQGDWVLLDAWFRSRSLEVPGLGTCMVPVLDMVNHAERPNAYYERDSDGDSIVLLLRPECGAAQGEEITLSYGEGKPAAEMLFNYGFVNSADTAAASSAITLLVPPDASDPFAKPKMDVFGKLPTLEISLDSSTDPPRFMWSCPFMHLSVMNQEDGLTFLLAHANDSDEDELRMFWKEEDVTDRAEDFETLTAKHPLVNIYRLRSVYLVAQALTHQLAKSTSRPTAASVQDGETRNCHRLMAKSLARQEVALMKKALRLMDEQYYKLLDNKSVQAHIRAVCEEDMDEFA